MKHLAIIATLLLSITTAEARPHQAQVGDTGRPSECYGIPWCGCWLRIQKGISDKAYNLASNWHRFGQRVSGPVIGAVAVLRHHVGLVVGSDDHGNPVIRSGNHNHRVGDGVYAKNRVIEYRM